MEKTVALLGALDTKGPEYQFVKEQIEKQGVNTFLIDTGMQEAPALEPNCSREELAQAVGTTAEALAGMDRGPAMQKMTEAVEKVVPRLYNEKKFDAILALGGTGGTSVACAAMRALPLGVPKVMVSTVAGGDVSAYVGVKDITMIPSIVDVAGVNKISREVFTRAAGAICGMVKSETPKGEDKPLIVASMFGNTTKAVDHAKEILEGRGYEVLVFHCTGTGGRTMESLVEAGLISGVLDLTTTEWADELVGGVFSAGPTRLEAAARTGVPAIVTPACLDMVNFWAPDTIDKKFEGRDFYRHNANVTLMRTTEEECRQLGRIMAEKINLSTGPVTVLLPLQGWSMIDAPGGDFWRPEANQALHESLKSALREDIPVIEMDCNVNAPEFSERCAQALLDMMEN